VNAQFSQANIARNRVARDSFAGRPIATVQREYLNAGASLSCSFVMLRTA
jgi:hypothetical protein